MTVITFTPVAASFDSASTHWNDVDESSPLVGSYGAQS